MESQWISFSSAAQVNSWLLSLLVQSVWWLLNLKHELFWGKLCLLCNTLAHCFLAALMCFCLCRNHHECGFFDSFKCHALDFHKLKGNHSITSCWVGLQKLVRKSVFSILYFKISYMTDFYISKQKITKIAGRKWKCHEERNFLHVRK